MTSPDPALVDKILEVVVDASSKACEIIRKNSEGADVVSKKSTGRDLLTMVDPLCEAAIRETIQTAFPEHSFLGEESVPPGIDAARQALEEVLTDPISDWLHIVDPIDGTTNFANGIPLNMPSIAVAYKGVVWIAVLNDPHRNELFTAVRGRGSFLNGERIRVSSEVQSLQDAIVGLESPAGQESLDACLKGIKPLMPRVRTIRMLGSSVVFLPWVANGRMAAYWTPDECAWDIAAGALIVMEAGGRVTDVLGNDYTLHTRSLVASNGYVHDELLLVLQDAGAIVECTANN
ncbi:MAG: hypothetical protein SGILL_003099 [Bacillariaceae sp.]